MVVKTIVDNEVGRKWEIIKHEEDRYSYNYYEFFKALGWKKISNEIEYYSKDAIEFEFGMEVA